MESQIFDSLREESVRPPTTFHDLNDFIVREVFGHLDDADLYTVVEVSTNFKQNAQVIFQRRYKSDRFNISVRGNDEIIRRERSEIHLRCLPFVMRIFGSWINSIGVILDNRVRKHSQKVLRLVSLYCGATLNEICLAQFKLTNELVPDLRPVLTRLKKLELHWCWWDSTFVASEMFSFCTEMHSLTISNFWNCEPFYQSLMLPKLKTFRLNRCLVSSDETMNAFLKNHPQLLGVAITCCRYISRKIFQTIAESIPTIGSLTFLSCGSGAYFEELKRLTKLKVLKIDCYFCSELIQPVLSALARAKSPLESLLLYRCRWTEGLDTAIAGLQGLKELEVTKEVITCPSMRREGDWDAFTGSDFRHTVEKLGKLSGLRLSFKFIIFGRDKWFDHMYFLPLDKDDYWWHIQNGESSDNNNISELMERTAMGLYGDSYWAEYREPKVGLSGNDLDTEWPYQIAYVPMPENEESIQMRNRFIDIYEKKGKFIYVTSRNETHVYPCTVSD